MTARKISLKVIPAPGVGHILDAPPVLTASDHSVDYACGHCGTVLLHADEGQVHGVLIRCNKCGSYNATDVQPFQSWLRRRSFDDEGIEFDHMDAVKNEAVRSSVDMLKGLNKADFWSGEPWLFWVTDKPNGGGNTVLTLTFSSRLAA